MRRRYSINLVRELFREAGCQLLEDGYRDNKTPMRYQCHCGTVAHIALQDFLKGARCGCGRKAEGVRRRLTIDRVRQYFADNGCTLLEESYEGNHTPLQFICNCGNVGAVSLSDFRNGIRCGCRKRLGLRRKWTEERVLAQLRQVIAEHGRFPGANQLSQLKRKGLRSAIQSLGGFNYFRHLLHQDLTTKPLRYWKSWRITSSESFGVSSHRCLSVGCARTAECCLRWAYRCPS